MCCAAVNEPGVDAPLGSTSGLTVDAGRRGDPWICKARDGVDPSRARPLLVPVTGGGSEHQRPDHCERDSGRDQKFRAAFPESLCQPHTRLGCFSNLGGCEDSLRFVSRGSPPHADLLQRDVRLLPRRGRDRARGRRRVPHEVARRTGPKMPKKFPKVSRRTPWHSRPTTEKPRLPLDVQWALQRDPPPRIPPESIEIGRAYLIGARNGGVGVAARDETGLRYIIAREKLGRWFLCGEADRSERFGSAVPFRMLPEIPPESEDLLSWLLDRQEEKNEPEMQLAFYAALGH